MSDSLPNGHALAAFVRHRTMAEPSSDELRVHIRSAADFTNLRGDPRSGEFLAAASAVLDQALPTRPNTVARGPHRVFWLGPDEWLIEIAAGQGSAVAAALRRRLRNIGSAVTGLNGGMIGLRLCGNDAAALLARGTTLDLHSQKLTAGDCAQTGLAKAPVLIAPIDDPPGFDIFVRRSYADYLALWLEHAGAEFGMSFTIAD